MHPEELTAILEEAENYKGTWALAFGIALKDNKIGLDDITFLARYMAAEGSALEYYVETKQAPTMSLGEPWDADAPRLVIQDDPDFRVAQANRAYRILAEVYQSTPDAMHTRHMHILRTAINWQNDVVTRRRE